MVKKMLLYDKRMQESDMIRIRVTAEQRALLHVVSKRLGQGLSTWLREMGLNHAKGYTKKLSSSEKRKLNNELAARMAEQIAGFRDRG